MNGIPRYVVFCDQPLSFSTMFPRALGTGECISTSCLFIAREHSTVWIGHILFHIYQLMGIWAVSTF